MTENLFHLYFAAAPLIILGLAYAAMRFYGYGEHDKHPHPGE